MNVWQISAVCRVNSSRRLALVLSTTGLILLLGNTKQSFCWGPPWVQEQVCCQMPHEETQEKHGKSQH